MKTRWTRCFAAVLLSSLAACQKEPAAGTPAPTAEAVTVTQSARASSDEAKPAAPAATAAPGASESTAELKVGDPAPRVTFTLQDGEKVDLASLAGQQVAVYFYPKDDTPGCTVEAQGIRDQWAEFQKAGIKVFGVSHQDAASHTAFIEKHELPFDLVVDTDGAVTTAFGVPVRGGEYAARHTFLIGKDGKVKQIWRDVKPDVHAKELLEAASHETPGTPKAG